MNLDQRSLLGGAVALLLVPFIAGLLACLPVPIGDPERSRVDIPLEGVWLDESFDAVWIIRVYDKRTWLVRMFDIVDNNSSSDNVDTDGDSYDELVRSMQAGGIGKDGYSAGTIQAYKVWRTKIAGESFLTWHTVGGFDGDGLAEPKTWLVWRVVEVGADTFELAMVNEDFSGFEKVEKTRRDYERVIRKRVNDPNLYVEHTLRWVRVRDEDLKLFRALADEIMAGPSD